MFEGLSEKLNTSYIETSASPSMQLKKIEDKKNELIELTKKDELSIQDEKYINDGLKELIEVGSNVFNTVASEVKFGVADRKIEVFAKLLDSMTNTIRELREFNKMIEDMRMLRNGLNPIKEEGRLQISAKDLADIVREASQNSELNRIDATFEVDDGEIQKPKSNPKAIEST
jgi:hypothetical protein